MAKIMISIDDELLKKIDDYAKTHYSSRSGTISYLTSEFFNSREILKILSSVEGSFEKVSENGELDENSEKEIENALNTIRLLTNSKK